MKPIKPIQPAKQAQKPLASISLDLDDLWSYMKTYGNKGWEDFPTYLPTFVPYVLDVLDSLKLKVTFFIVGRDIAVPGNEEILGSLNGRGHEVANHSFNHEPWFHVYSKEKIAYEIVETQDLIMRLTGQKPVGFRGPGFGWSPNVLEVLSENGYIYDSTTFPTYLGPILRAYYFRNPNLNAEDKRKRKKAIGGFADGLRPAKPYLWGLTSKTHLLEIPVSTIPLFKIPFHQSYLLFLSRFSIPVMLSYLKFALALCRLTNTEPSFLIHPTDLLDAEQAPRMRFFPGMEISAPRKLEILNLVIKELSKHYMLLNMRAYAESILKQGNLDIISPSKGEQLKNGVKP